MFVSAFVTMTPIVTPSPEIKGWLKCKDKLDGVSWKTHNCMKSSETGKCWEPIAIH